MWNEKFYKVALRKIKDEGFINKQPVNTLEDIYEVLSKILNYSADTIKGWGRPKSTGPMDVELYARLEELLCVPAGSLSKEKEETEEVKVQKPMLSDFNKNVILHCYEIMKDYLHDEEMENENCFSDMYAEIEKLRIAIPQDVYDKICTFIDENLAPIIYERIETFSECYTEKIGFFNEDGVWQVKTEEGMKEMCMAFLMKTMEIEQHLDEFAMTELHPLLV